LCEEKEIYKNIKIKGSIQYKNNVQEFLEKPHGNGSLDLRVDFVN